MKTASEQLQAWLDQEGRKQIWLATQVGSRPEQVSRWLSGVTPIPAFRKAIEAATGIPAGDWGK